MMLFQEQYKPFWLGAVRKTCLIRAYKQIKLNFGSTGQALQIENVYLAVLYFETP